MPRYKPRIPPSVLYILIMVCHIPGNFPSRFPSAAKPADCIDNRVRTMSKGYVNVTDVIPAKPPHINLRKGGRSAPGDGSANYDLSVTGETPAEDSAYPLVDIVCPKLDCRVGDNAYAVGAIPPHKPSPAFVCPHLLQPPPYREFVFFSASALYLVENF
jgi:hypothetical protein